MSQDGLDPDTKKVELIQQWQTPTIHKELQSFLGTVNYLSQFLAFLSDLCASFQSLLKKDTEFVWTPVHQKAFDEIKLHVSNDVKLQFYGSSKPLCIEVDTSKKGIGTVMLQEDTIVINSDSNHDSNHDSNCDSNHDSNCDSNRDSKPGSEIPTNLRPISYASKTLSTTESNYSNIECELLGLLFAVIHFEHFTYGRLVHVITDHKPLVYLFGKLLVDSSPRLIIMLVQLLDYTLDVTYQPGANMHLYRIWTSPYMPLRN